MQKRNLLPLLILIFTLILLSNKSDRNTPTASLNRKQFKAQLETALAGNDKDQISKLVRDNKYHVFAFVSHLLKKYLQDERTSNTKNAAENLATANYLAKLYQQHFKDRIFLEYIELYQNWQPAEKVLFLKGDSLNNLGVKLAQQGKLPEAMAKWRESVSVFNQIQDHFSLHSPLENIALAHRYLGRYRESSDTLAIALKLARKTKNSYSEANLLRECGTISHISGDPQAAFDYWKQATAIYEALRDTSALGTTMNLFGIYYRNLGKPEKALSYYHRALEFDRAIKNENEAGNVLNSIGNIYMDFYADYEKARNYFEQALEIKTKYEENFHVSDVLANIGISYKNQGDYAKGLEYFFNALKVAKEIGNVKAMARELSDIAASYTDLGMYLDAIPYYEQALDTLRRIGAKKLELETLINLGYTYKGMGDYGKAADYFRPAMTIAQKSEFGAQEAELYQCLADIESQFKNYPKAFSLYEKSLEMSKKINNKRQQGDTYIQLGELFRVRKEYEKALNNYREGLKIVSEINAPEGIWQAHYGIGSVLDSLNRREEAFAAYKQAIETIEAMREKLKARSFKESFMEQKIQVYEAMINLLLKMGKEEDAHHYLERSKARSFLDILSTGKINITEGISPERLKRKNELERELTTVQQELSTEYSKSENEQNKKQITSLERRQKKARQKYNELLQEIELNHPKYATLTGVTEPLTLKQIQQKVIRPGTFLIEYLVGEDQTIVWGVGKNSFVHEQLNLKREDLEKMVTDLLQPFRDVKEGKIKNLANIGYDLKLAQQLYQHIFQPIEKYVQKHSHLIIVPDGILYYLPFEALVTKIERKEFDRNVIFSRYENAHYLVERYAISYSSSASALDPTLYSSNKKAKKAGQLLAFGNPDFTKARETIQLAKDKAEEEASTHYPVIVSRSSRGRIFDQLPKAEEEVRVIAEILKPSLLYVGSDATEEHFKQKSGDFTNIHLATHCVVEETQPIYSRIVFAQDDDPTEDGFLHTYEVFNLNLNADLVTLGACETGLGKLSRGEGLIGLTRAFMYAGAPSVVVSLWSVDESTAELMKLFYQNLKEGMTKVEALRQAKLKLIQSNRVFGGGQKFSFAQPYLWAAFVLIGHWN